MPSISTDETTSLVELLNRISRTPEGSAVTLDEILDAVGPSAHGPLLAVPALIAIAQTGAIPGMSLLAGAILVLVSIQILFSTNKLWLPRGLRTTTLSRGELLCAIDTINPYVRKVDYVMKPCLTFLANPPSIYFVAVICNLLATAMFPLAFVPFAVALPATAET